jgi:restriction system protein
VCEVGGVKSKGLRKDDFYLPLLRLLDALGGSASNEEIESKLIEEFGFSVDDSNAKHERSGALIVPNKIAWARSYLKSAGLLHNESRGVWVMTEDGRIALKQGEAAIHARVAEAVKAYHARRAKEAALIAAEGSLDEDISDDANTWEELLLAKMKSIDPAAFERLCQRLLRESGFTRVEVTGKSGDGGIDGQGVLRVNLVSFHVLFQCKRYQGSVGSSVIRDFRGAMQGRADKGLVITTGTFTHDARKEATRDGAPAIDLIDGEALCLLLKEKKLGVKIRLVEEVQVDDAFFDEI